MIDERQCRQAVARLFYNNTKDQRDFDLILELINEHFDNREFKEKNFDTVCELYNSLLKDYEKVNKAFDKACDELKEWCLSCGGIDEELHCVYPNFKTKEEWKEWCFEDVDQRRMFRSI